jgi:type I restriction enzyme S subunit
MKNGKKVGVWNLVGLDQREKLMLYKEIVEKISVGVEKKLKQKEYLKEGLFEVVDQGQSLVGGFSNDSSLVVKCDLPVIVFGDHTKCVKFIDFPFVAGADGVKVLRAKECADAKFLYYYTLLLTKKMIDKGYARHYQFLEKMEVNIPSFDEQKRIVNKIEELFSELDSAVETLKKTKEQLAVYRQSVLKEAFTQFTHKEKIKDHSEFVTSGSRGWAKYYSDEGARFIRITDLTRDRIVLKNNDIQYVALPDNVEGKRSRLKANDILVSITADLGSIALIPKDIQEAYINQHIALVRLSNPESAKFTALYLKSDWGQKDLLKNKRGGGKMGLGLDDIRNTPIPIVSADIANKIVSQIESRLSACENIEKTVNDALMQADAMRQSILKKAFDGSL